MRILHTADWHLGDKLLGIRRTDDIRHNLTRIATYCEEHSVDVLVVAGDLFSDFSTGHTLREELEFLNATFADFLKNKGAIVAVAGNHDADPHGEVLRQAMRLAGAVSRGDLVPPGRWYFATQPTFLRLASREGHEFQFVLMPYPFVHRYAEFAQTPESRDQTNRARKLAYTAGLRDMQSDARFRRDLPSVLVAHVYVNGIATRNLFRITEEQDVVFDQGDLPAGWAYLALGHIHAPQSICGMPHARYAGSVQRLDFGERNDEKSVVLVDVEPGQTATPTLLPLDSTPLVIADLSDPAESVESLLTRFPEGATGIVHCRLTLPPNTDPLPITKAIRAAFPRSFMTTVRTSDPSPRVVLPAANQEDLIRGYLAQVVTDESERAELTRLLDELLEACS